MRAWILWLAARWRIKKDQPVIVAIGGAIAKTSTKTAIGAVLNEAFPGHVRVGYGNLNTLLGVPLAILGFEIDFYKEKIGFWRWLKILIQAKWRAAFSKLPKYLVLEFGTDQTGDLDNITKRIQPDYSVITIVGPAHLANYADAAAMANDEGFLAERTKPTGVVFINHADPYREEHRARAKAKVREIVTPLEIMATEYAKAVGQELKIGPATINAGLHNYQQPEHRFNQKKIGSWTLLDDSYNASPLAMEAALNRLHQLPGRHVAVLGEMRELGQDEVEFHTSVGRYAKNRADVIIGVGELAKNFQPTHWFATSDEAAKAIFSFLKEGDTILVKGSKAVHMQKIIDTLESTATANEHHSDN